MLAFTDDWRQAQARSLAVLGFGAIECGYRVIARGARWQLRAYESLGEECDAPPEGTTVLIVAAPIKRPYIWDLCPDASAVRFCLQRPMRVYLLEWLPATEADPDAGLDEYADAAIGEAVDRMPRRADGMKPVLMGHSLGGTFAAMFAAAHPERLQALVLLSAPLAFHPGVSHFRDALVLITQRSLPQTGIVPGSLLSQISAWAAPDTFIWSRLLDAAWSGIDPAANDVRARVERWMLDEVPLPARLVSEIIHWLYREDRFRSGTLQIGGQTVGPSSQRVPTLAVACRADPVAPPDSLRGFLTAAPRQSARLIEHGGEIGVGLQHLAVLVGRRAHAQVWPEIASWIEEWAAQG